jgi:hypothetical protein
MNITHIRNLKLTNLLKPVYAKKIIHYRYFVSLYNGLVTQMK